MAFKKQFAVKVTFRQLLEETPTPCPEYIDAHAALAPPCPSFAIASQRPPPSGNNGDKLIITRFQWLPSPPAQNQAGLIQISGLAPETLR